MADRNEYSEYTHYILTTFYLTLPNYRGLFTSYSLFSSENDASKHYRESHMWVLT